MPRETLPGFGDRLRIGDHLDASPFCLGYVDTPDAVLAAFDAGINFFFLTADMHWPLYEHSRRGLERLFARGGGIRDRVVVAGVSYATQPEFCSLPFQEILDNVRGLERIDVLLAGGAYGYELDRRLPVYTGHREVGFCGARAIGASFHDRAAVIPYARGPLDLCLVRYNADHTGARTELFAELADRRAKIYNFKSTAGYVKPSRCDELGITAEMWQPEITDHYRYVLTSEAIDGVLCSLSTPAHVEALADALEDGPLEPGEMQHLELLAKLGAGRAELA